MTLSIVFKTVKSYRRPNHDRYLKNKVTVVVYKANFLFYLSYRPRDQPLKTKYLKHDDHSSLCT